MRYIFLLLFLVSPAQALEVPVLTSPVMDQAQVLSEGKAALDKKIREIHKKGIIQITILTIESLEDEVLEEYSMRVVESWKLGDKEKDNGILILVAMKERKIRIEVGNGIEGEIPDVQASRVIDQMKSYMRSKDYDGALNSAVDGLVDLMEYNSPANVQQRAIEQELRGKELAEKSKAFFGVVKILFGTGGILSIFIVIAGGIRRKRELELEVPEKKEQIKLLGEYVLDKTKTLSGMSIDEKKHEYAKQANYTRGLTSKKNGLRQEIIKMKNYLGRR